MQAQGTAPANAFGDDIEVQQGRLTVRNESALRTERMDALVRQAVFGEGQAKDHAQWMIWETAQAVGVRPASIHDLYAARGRGEVHGFTVPAIDVPAAIRPFAKRWWDELQEELVPLTGKRIDPRFVASIYIE